MFGSASLASLLVPATSAAGPCGQKSAYHLLRANRTCGAAHLAVIGQLRDQDTEREDVLREVEYDPHVGIL